MEEIMAKVLVAYWTGTGNTEQMAEVLSEKLKEAGEEVELVNVADADPETASEYDKFALGCPAMGDEELEEDEFLPFYEEIKPLIGEKPVALFGSYSWNEGEWMTIWQDEAKESGLNLVDDGVICYEAPDEDEDIEALNNLVQALLKA